MKVLLTGILPHSIWTIAARLARGGDQVAVMGYSDAAADLPKGVSYYHIHPSHHEALKMLEAAHYEAVIFSLLTNARSRRNMAPFRAACWTRCLPCWAPLDIAAWRSSSL